MEPVVTRSIAGAGLALSLVVGGLVGSRLTLDTRDEVALIMARRIDPDQAQRKALEQEASYQDSEEFFQLRVDEAVAAHEVAAPEAGRLLQPNTFFHVASPGDPKLVAAGKSMREGGLQIRVKVEEIEVERRGLRTKNQHTIAQLQNVGASPLAYFLALRSGICSTEGDLFHLIDKLPVLSGKGQLHPLFVVG